MALPSAPTYNGALMAVGSLLGVDVGTHSAKGCAFDRDGRVLAAAEIAYQHDTPAPGWAEMDAERWWHATRDILRALTSAPGVQPIDALGVTGQAPTLVAVDADGRPLRPAILWLDVRSEADAAALAARLGPEAEALGGNRVHAYYLGPKLAWLRDHEPTVLERAATILQSHSVPVMRLTGARVTDYSSAALCAPLYDARSRAWSRAMCERLSIPYALLPALHPAHAVAGTVTAAAARETGVVAGTPVVVGGADFAASTLAAGVLDPGEACLMLGTSGNLIAPLPEPGFDTRLINTHHVGCERALTLGATLSGAVQEWFRGVAAPGVDFETLDAEAAGIFAGADGVTLLPYLQGERTPHWDAGARGAFLGLSLAHRRGHLYRAVLEGIAVSFRHCADVMRDSGVTLREVVAVDGGARSGLWRQIIADALGVPLFYLPDAAGAAAGAALLAGLGSGALASVETARRWRGPLLRHTPDPASTATYARMLAARKDLYPALRGIA
jgi:xylulokinase